MTHPEQSPDVAHNEPSVHGDVIQTEIGEHAQTVAAGKNIIQIIIDKLNLPPWLLYSTAVSLLVAAGSLGWFGYLSLVPGIPVVLPATPTPTLTPIASATPIPTPTSLPFNPEAEGEVLIVIATFDQVEKVKGNEPHKHIRLAIQAEAKALDFANLRVEVEPSILVSNDRDEAEALGQRYNASLVIWGEENTMLVAVNFLNRKQPDAEAADVFIREITRTLDIRQQSAGALASISLKPDPYNQFITQELPDQLTFLALFAVGQSYYKEQQYEQAAATIERAVQNLSPQTTIDGLAEAYFLLGWLFRISPLNMDMQAIAYYTKAIGINRINARFYINRGYSYDDLGNFELAVANFNKAIELDPANASAFYSRGVAYHRENMLQQALSDYIKALELDPTHTSAQKNRNLVESQLAPHDDNRIFIIANGRIGVQEKYSQSIIDLTKVIELDPRNATAFYNRGNAYKFFGIYDQALPDYTKAIELNPVFALAYTGRGDTYYNLERYKQALSDYTKAIELDPLFALAYAGRGLTYSYLEEYGQALFDYNKAIELDPVNIFVYEKRGLIYDALKQHEQAITDFTAIIELDPDYAAAYNNRGLAYAKQGVYEQAIADFTEAIELDPTEATTYSNRGLVYYYAQREYDKAIADFTKAIELNHDPLSWPYYGRGLAYYDQKQYEQAIADYTKAIELDPDYAPAYYNRGNAYYDQEQFEQAIADYTKAIELGPKDAPAYNNRGLAYENLGQHSTALDDYRTYTKLAPDDPDGWNKVCWWGSLTGVAADVLSACEQAVRLSNGVQWVLDSRGLARALTGDIEGAIVDFTAYVEWSKKNDLYETHGKKREAWIAALQRGENPFDGATLAELRKE